MRNRPYTWLQYVEFSTGDDEDKFDAQDVLKRDEKLKDSLEVKLMEKNKRLENDYTQLKVSYSSLENNLKSKTALYEELKTKNTQLAELVQRLEEDLLRLGQKTSNGSLVEELTRTPSSTNLASGGGQSSPRTPDYGSPRVSLDASSIAPAAKEDKSILPIVINQRDRFRQRNAELEEQLRSINQKTQDLQSEIETLKADNLKLYERLRFVHVWKEEGLTVRSEVVTAAKKKELWYLCLDSIEPLYFCEYGSSGRTIDTKG